MNLNRISSAVCLAAMLSLVAPTVASAGEFGTNNVQLLQGWNFHDNNLGYDTPTGKMTTVTLNFFNTWSAGDNFAFVDMYRGDLLFSAPATAYAEWHPRLFLNKLLKSDAKIPLVKNWGVAAEINEGNVFYAYMGGLGLDLDIPGFQVAGLNIYYRYDNYNYSTWQLSPFWAVPFSIGPTDWAFTGFLDMLQTHNTSDNGLDVMTQPELLIDVSKHFGAPGKLMVGVEWYLHYNKGITTSSHWSSAPQAMIQWTTF